MKRALTSASMLLFTTLGLGCGGGEPEPAPAPPVAEPAPAPAPPAATMPAWFRVNGTNVEIDVLAGATPENNNWNFNGGFNGDMTVTVPVGAVVTVNFKNGDANKMVHSLGIVAAGAPAPTYTAPVFTGAATADPSDMAKATLGGEKESIHFTADKAGQYTMVCFIAGHGLAGMWIHFNVGGEPGVTGDKGATVAVN